MKDWPVSGTRHGGVGSIFLLFQLDSTLLDEAPQELTKSSYLLNLRNNLFLFHSWRKSVGSGTQERFRLVQVALK